MTARAQNCHRGLLARSRLDLIAGKFRSSRRGAYLAAVHVFEGQIFDPQQADGVDEHRERGTIAADAATFEAAVGNGDLASTRRAVEQTHLIVRELNALQDQALAFLPDPRAVAVGYARSRQGQIADRGVLTRYHEQSFALASRIRDHNARAGAGNDQVTLRPHGAIVVFARLDQDRVAILRGAGRGRRKQERLIRSHV